MGQFTINHIDKTMTIHQDVSDGHMSIMYDKPNWLIDMLSARIMNLELERTPSLEKIWYTHYWFVLCLAVVPTILTYNNKKWWK